MLYIILSNYFYDRERHWKYFLSGIIYTIRHFTGFIALHMNKNVILNEDIYRKMVDEVEDYAIILLDKNGNILNWNKGAEKIKGYKAKEIIGKNFTLFYTKEDQLRKRPEELLELAGKKGKTIDESWRQRKDGSLFWGYITITALHDHNDKVIGFTKVTRDLTQRKETENKINELHKELAERKVMERTVHLKAINEELEAFSYSISHDLRAPLRAIHGYSKILIEDYSEKLDKDAVDTINVILRNTVKMTELIDELLAFSRLGRKSLTISKIEMNGLLQIVLDENQKEGREILFKIDNLLPVMGDYTLIKQVWTNLISNAIKYSGKEPVSEIEIGNFSDEGFNTYYIKDNGVGFDMKYYNKLFGVFQRLHTQDEFEGTGVGLAFVKKIIKHHGGSVWAESKEDEGATFFFKLESNN